MGSGGISCPGDNCPRTTEKNLAKQILRSPLNEGNKKSIKLSSLLVLSGCVGLNLK